MLKVLLDKVVVQRERDRLRKENMALENLVKQFANGLTVNDEVMKHAGNSLLIVNGQVTVNTCRTVEMHLRTET